MNLEKAKNMLLDSNYTCVFCNGDEILTTTKRGVKPLLEYLDTGRDFSGFSAADKVIGKAAAYLYVLLGIKKIYASIISEYALMVFEKYSISVDYSKCVPAIVNRDGTGFCPMESAVLDTDDPQEAFTAISETLKRLN